MFTTLESRYKMKRAFMSLLSFFVNHPVFTELDVAFRTHFLFHTPTSHHIRTLPVLGAISLLSISQC